MTTELQQRGRKYKKVKEREVTELNTITELKTILEGFNSRLDRWNRRKDQWSWKQSSGTHTIRAAKRIKSEKVWR